MAEPISEEQLQVLAEKRRKEQAAEYGQFVAAQDIHHDGGLAYVAGAPVPVSNVKLHGYLQNGLVVTVEQANKQREAALKADEQARAADQAERDAAYEAALKAANGEPQEQPPADEPKKPSK